MKTIAETINCKYALMYSGSGASPFELQAASSLFPGSEEFPSSIRDTQIARYLEEQLGYRVVCALEKTPGVKVLISTGYTSPEKIPLLERIGIEGFVHKPFELVKLAATVRDVLDGVVV